MNDFLVGKFYFKLTHEGTVTSQGNIIASTKDQQWYEVFCFDWITGDHCWNQVKNIEFFTHCVIFDSEEERADWFERVGKHRLEK
jgi:hypothetical protein